MAPSLGERTGTPADGSRARRRRWQTRAVTDGLVIPELDAGPFLLRPFRVGDLPLLEEAAADPYIPRDQLGAGAVQRGRRAGVRPAAARPGPGVRRLLPRDRRPGRGPGGGPDRAVGDRARRGPGGDRVLDRAVGPRARRGRARAGRGGPLGAADLAIPRVHLHVEPWNTASVRTAERAGFRRRGPAAQLDGAGRGTPRHAAVRPRSPPTSSADQPAT